MQQMWLLLDSRKDNKQRQILKKVFYLPKTPYQPSMANKL